MLSLFVFKEKLRAFYGKYDIFIISAVKFILAFTAMILINKNIGYMAGLKHPLIPVIFALISAILPYGAIVWIISGYFMSHIAYVSPEMALIIAVFLIAIALLYYGFHPGDSYLLIIIPILFTLKIPYVIPIILGLGGSIISIIPAIAGVVIFYLLSYVKSNVGALSNDASIDITQKYLKMINSVVSNKTMLLFILVFAITILVVYLIHNLSIDYSWQIAIVAGAITILITVFIGDFVFNIASPMAQLIVGVLLSTLIAFVYNFYIFAVDYTRTEYTQFEDDEYYYYVKAVPKITVSTPDVKIQKINGRKSQKKRDKDKEKEKDKINPRKE